MGRPRVLSNRTVRRHTLVAGVLLASVMALPGQAAPADPRAPVVSAEPASAQLLADGDLPGTEDLPQGQISTTFGVATATQGAVARASKMYITIGPDAPIWTLVYLGLHNAPIEDPTSTVQAILPYPFHQPSCATDDPATQKKANYIRSVMYPIVPAEGGGGEVGVLARTSVNLVAFGSIPATATVTMRLARENGKLRPLTVGTWGPFNSGSNTERQGCDRTFKPRPTGLVEGDVDIAISNLEIDGVPVALGSTCTTKRPVDLRLFNESDYNVGQGGNLGAYDGLSSGSVLSLDSPYYFEDEGRDIPASSGVDIPAFVGCGAGGDDLSPIVTAMVSGPNNPVRAVQGKLSVRLDTSVQEVLGDLSACGSLCPLPAPNTPERPPLPDEDTP